MSKLPTKTCDQCGQEFTPSKYAVKRARFCSTLCGNRHHQSHNREMHVEKSRRWREANPEKRTEISRRALLKRKYGLTVEDYDALLMEQDGRCAICRKTPERACSGRSAKYLYVDHDHVTGKVRGLLCGHCNTVLGSAEDSPSILRCAIHYLESTTYAAALD